MTKVYVVHITGYNSTDDSQVGGIFTKMALATARQELLERRAKEVGYVVDTFIETVTLDE